MTRRIPLPRILKTLRSLLPKHTPQELEARVLELLPGIKGEQYRTGLRILKSSKNVKDIVKEAASAALMFNLDNLSTRAQRGTPRDDFGAKVDTAVEVVPTNVQTEDRVKSWVMENDSGEGVHGKQQMDGQMLTQQMANQGDAGASAALQEVQAPQNEQKTTDCMKDKTKMANQGGRYAGASAALQEVQAPQNEQKTTDCMEDKTKGQSAAKGEKAKVTSREEHGSATSPAASKRIQDDMQKQFESGTAARNPNAGIGFKS